MNNLYDDQIVLVNQLNPSIRMWDFISVTIRKTPEGFRVNNLINGEIWWVKRTKDMPCWSVCFTEKYEKPEVESPALHTCKFDDRVEFDKVGRVFMYCLCGNHVTKYLPNARLTEVPKQVVSKRERVVKDEAQPFFKAFVWSDWDFKTGVWLNLTDRGDGFFQGYIDNPNAMTFDKYVVMKDKKGRYIINHPHSRKEGIRAYIPQSPPSDYTK